MFKEPKNVEIRQNPEVEFRDSLNSYTKKEKKNMRRFEMIKKKYKEQYRVNLTDRIPISAFVFLSIFFFLLLSGYRSKLLRHAHKIPSLYFFFLQLN